MVTHPLRTSARQGNITSVFTDLIWSNLTASIPSDVYVDNFTATIATT